MKSKKVYLIGAGPGRADLITIRGMNILKEADVILYDYLVDKALLEDVKDDAELICCDQLIKGRRHPDGFLKRQENINKVLVKKAKEGNRVARLKNGDPSIFSRSSQELDALTRNNIEFEIVPGVTAASAAACFSGIPLTDRRFASSCVFVTGREDPGKGKSSLDWKSLSKIGTLALYMSVGNIKYIAERMLEAGKDEKTPVAVIENATRINQKVVKGTLKDISARAKRDNIEPPAIIIVGEVASMERDFNWLKKSKRVLFTGLSKERYFERGIYFHLPLIRILPMKDYRQFDRYIVGIRKFDWIVYASRYGVDYFFKRLKHVGYDSRKLADIKIAAIGKSTKNELLDFGVLANLLPKEESSRGLIEAFKKINLKEKKIFMPRSNISDKGLKDALRKLGAHVTTGIAYRNVAPKDLPSLELKFFNEIVFTSPSTVRNFKKRYKKVPKNVKIRCIGSITYKEAKRCRLLS